jgi:hypothetical protein
MNNKEGYSRILFLTMIKNFYKGCRNMRLEVIERSFTITYYRLPINELIV